MSLATIWRDVNSQWSDINSLATSLSWELYDQQDWIMNNLAAYRGDLWQNQSRSIDALEQLTFNSVWMIELTLDSLIQALDISAEARLSNIKAILNTHLHNITDYIEDAVNLVNTSGSMDYDYVDTQIYWAVYDVNLELDSLQSQIDAFTGISETKVIELIDDAITELWTDTLLTINTVKNNLLIKINDVYDYVDDEIMVLSSYIDDGFILAKTYIDDQAATIIAYVDTIGGDIYEYVTLKLNAAKRYIDAQIEAVAADLDIVADDLRTEFAAQLVTLETTLDTRRDEVVSDIMVIMVNLELSISARITAVSASVSVLTETTIWDKGFFDIFRSTPELSFLQVLLRDEAKFVEFKPYWQALFARVMSED